MFFSDLLLSAQHSIFSFAGLLRRVGSIGSVAQIGC
jgi:hypothetical protein